MVVQLISRFRASYILSPIDNKATKRKTESS